MDISKFYNILINKYLFNLKFLSKIFSTTTKNYSNIEKRNSVLFGAIDQNKNINTVHTTQINYIIRSAIFLNVMVWTWDPTVATNVQEFITVNLFMPSIQLVVGSFME